MCFAHSHIQNTEHHVPAIGLLQAHCYALFVFAEKTAAGSIIKGGCKYFYHLSIIHKTEKKGGPTLSCRSNNLC